MLDASGELTGTTGERLHCEVGLIGVISSISYLDIRFPSTRKLCARNCGTSRTPASTVWLWCSYTRIYMRNMSAVCVPSPRRWVSVTCPSHLRPCRWPRSCRAGGCFMMILKVEFHTWHKQIHCLRRCLPDAVHHAICPRWSHCHHSLPALICSGFLSGFRSLDASRVLFMQSDGGLTPVGHFTGCRAILSGPAGGVVGYASTAYDMDTKQPVIGFDMGGTSTDVWRRVRACTGFSQQ